MEINRDIWKKSDINNLPCPHCNKSLKYKEIKTEQTERGECMQDCNCESNEYIFTGELSCTCGNHFFIYGDKDTQEYQEKTTEKHQIKGIYPTLNLFKLPASCPQTVKEELIKSFALYWVDLKACANKIRISIELFLDAEKIKKTKTYYDKKTQQKKKKNLTLYNRIKLYHKHDLKQFLHANRIIGNKGSHSNKNQTLSEDDVLDAYEFVCHVLTTVYETPKLKQKTQKYSSK